MRVPGSTKRGQGTGKEVPHILLVKMFLSGEGHPNPPMNSTLEILHITLGLLTCPSRGNEKVMKRKFHDPLSVALVKVTIFLTVN